jgi:glutathione-regulated potassium-efflux system ancillary protein KefC
MEQFFFDLSIILAGSALLSVVAVTLQQPIILAYIVCGICVGPWGFGWIQNVQFMEVISHLGITLLLFLAGLNLHPQKLIHIFRKVSMVTFASSLISLAVGFVIPLAFNFPVIDSLCIGLAMMFSSTILVVKLLPTTELHHQRMGAVCIGVLILQDLLAVAALVFIRCLGAPEGAIFSFMALSAKLLAFIAALVAFEYYVLRKWMARVDRLHEALFILGLAWCFGVASISANMGLFHETGAFFSGVVLARRSIARFISEELKPLRDFFLVLFFFTLGARLDLSVILNLFAIVGILTAFFVFLKPLIFRKLFVLSGEKPVFAKEAGVRLGQLSEFGLLIGILAFQENHITSEASQLIQLVTILTIAVSSYYVFRKYPTPIGLPGGLMKD